MQSWRLDLRAEDGPKYAAIAAALTRAIREGALRPGERLPPQRVVARDMHVDLTTVTRAYNLVREAGLIEGAGRLGSFVRNNATAPLAEIEEALSDTGMNMPPQPPSFLLGEALRTGTAALLRAGGPSPLLQYQPSGGALHDRAAGAAAMTLRGLPASADEVIVTAGGQNALHAILGTVLASGGTICAGRHVYPGLLALAGRFGLHVQPIGSDQEGLDPDALETAARSGARAVYVVPTNDNPTTATMGYDRRQAIVDVARRHGLIIVEDDAYGRLPSMPVAPLAALAAELTWHIASTSKVISPALRVAHVRAPSAQHAWRLAADVHETAVMAPPLNAALVTAWMREGDYDRMIGAVRAEAVARQRIALGALSAAEVAYHPEGYHLWLTLGRGIGAAEIVSAMRPTGLSVVAGEAFAVRKDEASPAVRLSIGGAIDHERLRRAFQRLEALFERGTARSSPMV